ncbi:MAG: D-glycero-beta-D-manno-heptose 1-phosphate adenylyltransferase [Patescibacteria group bacterium]|nr:D-glycero-beta-D-manno-heptose 1-phosphate adenylyltransferase [Patescibacteria group bacterium]
MQQILLLKMSDYIKFLDKFPKLKVLVIGDAILDVFLKGESSRVCREAPVPVVDCRQVTQTPGGAANTAVNVATMGAEVYLLTVIGSDQEGKALLEKLKSFKVNTEWVLKDGRRTTLVKQRVNSDFQMVVRIDSGSRDGLEKKTQKKFIKKLAQIYTQFDAVIVSDYNKGVMTKRIIKELAKLQQKNPRVLIADSGCLKQFAKVKATAVKPNYQETIELLGMQKKEIGENRIRQIWSKKDQLLTITGAESAAVTLDVDGAMFFGRGGLSIRTRSRLRDHKNASGAGDTFTAALALSLSAGATTAQAARICSQATSLVLEQPGTTPCFLAQLRQSLSFDQNTAANLSDLKKFISGVREQNKKIVFTNGCFDILHVGHTAYLSEAKRLGDVLIVGVNSDGSVRRLKGSDRPVNALSDRMAVLSALVSVDLVVSFAQDTPIDLIKLIKPDIYVKGGDYSRESLPETPVVEGYGGMVKIIPIVYDRSTTKIIKKVKSRDNPKPPTPYTQTYV